MIGDQFLTSKFGCIERSYLNSCHLGLLCLRKLFVLRPEYIETHLSLGFYILFIPVFMKDRRKTLFPLNMKGVYTVD